MSTTENTPAEPLYFVVVSDTDYRSSLSERGKRAAHEAALAAFVCRDYPIVRVYAAGGPAPTRAKAPLAVYARDERSGAVIARHPAGTLVGTYSATR